jgi:hypothetical protein
MIVTRPTIRSKLIAQFAGGGDQVVQATSNYYLLSNYAVHRTNGTLSLLVVNKSRTDSLTATIALTGFAPQSAATVYSYGIPRMKLRARAKAHLMLRKVLLTMWCDVHLYLCAILRQRGHPHAVGHNCNTKH